MVVLPPCCGPGARTWCMSAPPLAPHTYCAAGYNDTSCGDGANAVSVKTALLRSSRLISPRSPQTTEDLTKTTVVFRGVGGRGTGGVDAVNRRSKDRHRG